MTPKKVSFSLGLVATLMAGSVSAAPIDWSGQRYTFYLNKEPVAAVLREIAGREGIPVEVAKAVDTKVSGSFEDVKGEQIFRNLVSGYGLVYYYDGYKLHIDQVGKAKSASIQLYSIRPQEFRQKLIDKGIYDDRFYLSALDREGIVMVSGPEAYVNRVKQIAQLIKRRGRLYDVFYRWTDESGRTHFTDDGTAAPDEAEKVRVARRSGNSDPGVVAQVPAATPEVLGFSAD